MTEDRWLFMNIPSRYRRFCQTQVAPGARFLCRAENRKKFFRFFSMFLPQWAKTHQLPAGEVNSSGSASGGSDGLAVQVVHQGVVADQPNSPDSAAGTQTDAFDRRAMVVRRAGNDERGKARAGQTGVGAPPFLGSRIHSGVSGRSVPAVASLWCGNGSAVRLRKLSPKAWATTRANRTARSATSFSSSGSRWWSGFGLARGRRETAALKMTGRLAMRIEALYAPRSRRPGSRNFFLLGGLKKGGPPPLDSRFGAEEPGDWGARARGCRQRLIFRGNFHGQKTDNFAPLLRIFWRLPAFWEFSHTGTSNAREPA